MPRVDCRVASSYVSRVDCCVASGYAPRVDCRVVSLRTFFPVPAALALPLNVAVVVMQGGFTPVFMAKPPA